MEKDELVKKLQIAKDFVSQIENLFGIAQQCENGYILAQNYRYSCYRSPIYLCHHRTFYGSNGFW